TISLNPTSLTVNRGTSGTSTINIARTNFTSAVSCSSFTGLPSGVTASCSPSSTTGNSLTLTVSASSTATLGSSNVTISCTGGGLTQTATLALTIGNGSGGTGGVTLTPVVASSSGYFNEEDLKLANTGLLTALSVTIVVQRTTGISFNGQYNTVGNQITQ